jgi:hypothetical protein
VHDGVKKAKFVEGAGGGGPPELLLTAARARRDARRGRCIGAAAQDWLH